MFINRFTRKLYESRYDLLSTEDLLKEYHSTENNKKNRSLNRLIKSDDLSILVNVRFNDVVQTINIAKIFKKFEPKFNDLYMIKRIDISVFGGGANNLHEFCMFKHFNEVPFTKIISKVTYNGNFEAMIEEMFFNSDILVK